MTAATVQKIAARTPNLAGIKHAVNDPEMVSELLVRLGPDFRIFCGLESVGLPMLSAGAAGLVNIHDAASWPARNR